MSPEASEPSTDKPSAYAELLARVDLFAGLDRVALARLAAYLDPLPLAPGDVLFHEGDIGDALYIVARGTLGIYVQPPDGGSETRLGTLTPGDPFGEMAVLTDEPRSATVRAEGPAELLRLERHRFLDLLQKHPTLALRIVTTLSSRLRARDRTIVQSDRVIASIVETSLARLPPERRHKVMEVTLLEEISPSALEALHGPEAAQVLQDLAAFGITLDQPSPPILQVLRNRFEQEVGIERVREIAQQVALRLADAYRWDACLPVLARYAPRQEFVSALARALSAVPPLSFEESVHWVAQVTDEEAAQHGELAVAKASLYESRGDTSAALQLLRRALGVALVDGDAERGRLLTEHIARLSVAAGSPVTAGLEFGLRSFQVRRRVSGRKFLPVAAAVALVAAAAFIYRTPQWTFLLLLAAALILWATEAFPSFMISLGLVAASILLGVADAEHAAAGFGSIEWMFVVAVFGIAAAIARSGLLFRVGLLLVRRMPQGLFWQAGTLLLTGIMLGPLLPMAMGRAALTAPLALAATQAMRLRDREPAAATLGLASWIGAGPMLFLFLNASPACLLAWGLLPEASRQRFDWIRWVVAAAPLGVLIAVGALAAMFLILRPKTPPAAPRERLELPLAVLGPLSRREVAMIAVLVLTVAGWLAGRALHIDAGTVAVLGLIAAVLTGNLDREALHHLDWDYLIFYGVVISAGRLFASLELDRAAAETVGAGLLRIGATPVTFVLGIAVITMLARLVADPDQVLLLLLLAFIPVARTVGVDPWVAVITILASLLVWFVPAQTPEFLAAHSASEGRLYSYAQAQRVALGYAAAILAALMISMPYWRLLGLM